LGKWFLEAKHIQCGVLEAHTLCADKQRYLLAYQTV